MSRGTLATPLSHAAEAHILRFADLAFCSDAQAGVGLVRLSELGLRGVQLSLCNDRLDRWHRVRCRARVGQRLSREYWRASYESRGGTSGISSQGRSMRIAADRCDLSLTCRRACCLCRLSRVPTGARTWRQSTAPIERVAMCSGLIQAGWPAEAFAAKSASYCLMLPASAFP